MRLNWPLVFWATIAASQLPAAAGAQPAPRSRADSVSAVLGRLGPGSAIRVAAGGLLSEGRLGISTDASITIIQPGTTRSIILAGVERIWTRSRATGLGAIVGGIAGAALGLWYALAIREVCEAGCDSPGFYVGVPLIFGAGGAGLGALIGAAIPRWRLRFP
jgi:hypothetical protein